MTNPRPREPALDVALHAAPLQVITLAAPVQDLAPQVTDCLSSNLQPKPFKIFSWVQPQLRCEVLPCIGLGGVGDPMGS